MNERIVTHAWRQAAIAWAVASAAMVLVRPAWALSVAAGGAWNLASLLCLAQMLKAWLGPVPSQRRAIAWLLLKFPLLYVLVYQVLRTPSMSFLAFGLGFTLVLLVVVGSVLLGLQRTIATARHGR